MTTLLWVITGFVLGVCFTFLIRWGFEEWCDFKNETFFESDEELPYGKNPNDNQGRGGCK